MSLVENFMKNEMTVELEINDLADVAAELSDEELQAVSGARWAVSWSCGTRNMADEWTV
jgi:hypothetical protein